MSTDPRDPPTAEPSLRLDLALLAAWPMPRPLDGDKFDHGTALVIGGATETPGAVILAGTAALRMGAGRLQIATAPAVATAVAVAMPEALVVPVVGDGDELRSRIAAADAVLIGPGVSAAGELAEVVHAVIEVGADTAVAVVDAEALHVLAEVDRAALDRWRGRIVITPNRGEALALLDRVSGDLTRADGSDTDGEPIPHEDVLEILARRTGAVVTSFGLVRCPDGRAWLAAAGHPGLGTSGSGDVLAGLVVGAAARCGDAAQAACWATWAHAAAGQLLGRRYASAGFLARELLDAVPEVLPAEPQVAARSDPPRDGCRAAR